MQHHCIFTPCVLGWVDKPNCRAAIYVVPFQVLAHLLKNQLSLTHIIGAVVMEAMVKKYQQKLRKVRDEINRWDDLQSRLLSQFKNASSIIERLQVIEDSKNYGSLNCMDDIVNAVLTKQVESLEVILVSMKKTMYRLKASVVSALSTLTFKPSASDLCALQQLLVDQPNIPKDEVQSIFDIIFVEAIC
ncbi:uncharacterized protein At5g43822 isoform X3 [Corylus avellana]|uniref:uncharacterized protein At5g43822 isoform X3 n=1 Tax=Corylus avellana TaxID=13451 RepID=UPI00286C0DA6|nr:uncharacterized protein At5g43822 isoform X3 [Corylus avellana]